jgi:hypothetical protein
MVVVAAQQPHIQQITLVASVHQEVAAEREALGERSSSCKAGP